MSWRQSDCLRERHMPSEPTAEELNAMLVDAAIHVGRGIGTNKVSLKASIFLADHHRKSFIEAIKNRADPTEAPLKTWENDRGKVLAVAVRLGKEAKRLAGKKTVSESHAKRAAEKAKLDAACPGGGGKYCPQ